MHYKYGVRSFNAQDMEALLRDLRAGADKEAKLALIWDNSGIHRARSVRDLASSAEINIRLVWNIPYRPDLATRGIELIWA